jgi:hypothetical protein
MVVNLYEINIFIIGNTIDISINHEENSMIGRKMKNPLLSLFDISCDIENTINCKLSICQICMKSSEVNLFSILIVSEKIRATIIV